MRIIITLELDDELQKKILKLCKDRDMTPEQYLAFGAEMGIEMQVEEDEACPTVKVACTRCGQLIYVCSDEQTLICNDCLSKTA